jgi:hypothetical protein
MQMHLLSQVADAVELFRAGAADHAVNFVAPHQQEFREVRTILTRNPSDKRSACQRNPL